MKVFPQFAAPVIITLRYFPRPFSSNSCTDLENLALLTLLFQSTSVAHLIRCAFQRGKHSCLALSCNSGSRVLRARSSLSPACYISHVVSRSSVTTFRDRQGKNCIRSCFPSFVCSYARAWSSAIVFIFFVNSTCDTLYAVNHFFSLSVSVDTLGPPFPTIFLHCLTGFASFWLSIVFQVRGTFTFFITLVAFCDVPLGTVVLVDWSNGL